MLQDPISAKDANLHRPDRDGNGDELSLLSEAWTRLDLYEPGLRALIEGAFAHAHFHTERLASQRVATGTGVATVIGYMAHRDDLARPMRYHLIGTLTWDPAAGENGRFQLDWHETTLQYGDSERAVSFPASIDADGTPAVNDKAFADAVATAMG